MKRACGSCTLCCRLIPVEEIGKHAGQRCKAQFSGGCRAHALPEFPISCAAWSCMWLTDEATSSLRRPDRSRYVIDPTTDVVRNAEGKLLRAIQVWCDPDFPKAWRDPALLAYIEGNRLPAIIRFDRNRSIFIVPPCLSADCKWIEIKTELAEDIPGSVHSRMKKLGLAI